MAYMGGGRAARSIAAAALVGLAVAGSVWAAPGGKKRASHGRAPASVSLLTDSQANMLRFGYARVRVHAPARRSVRVLLSLDGPGKSDQPVARGLLVRFRHAGSRTLRLPLTPKGKQAIGGCDAMRLDASGRARRRGRRKSTNLRSSGRSVRSDAGRCRVVGAPKGGSTGGATGGSSSSSSTSAPPPLGAIDTTGADRCDFLDPSVCLYPWPNDYFTTADSSTDTNRRLNLNLQSMPKNKGGKPIDPTDQNRGDGFSPGSAIVTKVPGLDTQKALEQTGAVPIWDMARSFDQNQPVVVINAATKQRQLIWVEVDANPQNKSDRTVIIRPGTNFREGQRYIVALRNLRDENGNLLKPREEFRAYRDGLVTQNAALEARRPHYEDLFQTLGQAGIARNDLYLAWDFTVASRRSLTDRMLFMRDDAFGQAPLPGGAPPTAAGGLGDSNLADLTVQGSAPVLKGAPVVTDFTSAQDSRIARQVDGRILVPCYLTPNCASGSQFALGPDGRPVRTAVPHEARFTCNIPRVALEDGSPGDTRISLYGHGLLGSRGEVNQDQLKNFAQEHNIVFCATEWSGMACGDLPDQPGFDPNDPRPAIEHLFNQVIAGTAPSIPDCDFPTVLGILQDLSLFPKLADRVQQGMLNFLYLGREAIHPNGFKSLDAFKVGGTSILDTTRLYYDGNSQGGIIGGSLAAIGVDHERAALGVPGMNYSTLLQRSVDFDSYANGNFEGIESDAGLYDNYPNELERPLIINLIQLLWDRAEADGYAQHMTSDPLPNTPPHRVLLHVGFGDHQVADVTPEVEARTIGDAGIYKPVLDDERPRFQGRPPDEKSKAFFGLPTLTFPWPKSALVYWDIGPLRPPGCEAPGPPDCDGVTPPPPTNTPNRQGVDPHEHPRRSAAARQQKSDFFHIGGNVTDQCGPKPCYAFHWTGP